MYNGIETSYQIIMESAHHMVQVESQSIDLVVTSPPYPMIQLWDNQFIKADPSIEHLLSQNKTAKAFELMHRNLDGVWEEVARVIKPGGIVCVNIGDATRSFDGEFQLFSNHSRIIAAFMELGFYQLPAIIWRKPTNAPTKFMGSGMYPPGAYVTLEHEYIIIFRKGGKRIFHEDADKQLRRQSAYFWEERNSWFSDVWTDLRGVNQNLKKASGRMRSGAFPLELPFRLINMFSIMGDRVLDPFLGTGTTFQAAMCTGRNAIGYELSSDFHPIILENISFIPEMANNLAQDRLNAHRDFINERIKAKGDVKHQSRYYGFAVMTRQEVDLRLSTIQHIQYMSSHRFKVSYTGFEDSGSQNTLVAPGISTQDTPTPNTRGRQLKLF